MGIRDGKGKGALKTRGTKGLSPSGSLDPFVELISEGADVTKNRGLCSICEDREVCAFPKPEGAVWHCEEYR